MPRNKQIPINRSNKFFSGDDFDLEIDFGREWLEGDINIKVILFQVDRQNSLTDSLYGEAEKDGITFKPPVEISVNFKMDEPTNKAYNSDGSMRYKEHGNVTFGVYQKHLKELEVDITYGDYIGYQEDETKIKYFTVANDGKVNSDNKHTINGYKGFYRTVVCVPTSEDEFNG
jgi:hypothetical protein|tara:strand:+ start:550 stop:1068 length:519 start_codon:yes stop_codon:yes gene_type:complete